MRNVKTNLLGITINKLHISAKYPCPAGKSSPTGSFSLTSEGDSCSPCAQGEQSEQSEQSEQVSK